jgi:hypothetical protein
MNKSKSQDGNRGVSRSTEQEHTTKMSDLKGNGLAERHAWITLLSVTDWKEGQQSAAFGRASWFRRSKEGKVAKKLTAIFISAKYLMVFIRIFITQNFWLETKAEKYESFHRKKYQSAQFIQQAQIFHNNYKCNQCVFEIEGSLKNNYSHVLQLWMQLANTSDRIWGISYVCVCVCVYIYIYIYIYSISSTKHPGKQCDVKVQ